MKRTTIALSDELARLVVREAKRRDTSVSEIVRGALARHLGVTPGEVRALPFAGLGGSGHRRTARDAEKILAREWARVRGR